MKSVSEVSEIRMANTQDVVADRRDPSPDGEGEYWFRLRKNGSAIYRRPFDKRWLKLTPAKTFWKRGKLDIEAFKAISILDLLEFQALR